jgi:1-acyl-sn-glycerol-3-phosphate acyltransferase
VTGSLPNLPKFIFIAAPHTSNWDFPLGLLTMYVAGFRVSWFGKASLFRPPLGPLMRWLGGLPIDRSAAHGVVEQTVEAIRRAPSLLLALAPEGTRRRVTQWRTGFYHVAHGAGIPVVLAYFDYGKREVGFGPTMLPSGDLDRDLAAIQAFYRGVTARHPALFATGADPD